MIRSMEIRTPDKFVDQRSVENVASWYSAGSVWATRAGMRLRERRRNADLSQRQLSKLSRLSQSLLHRIESGERIPTWSEMTVLAFILDTEVDRIWPTPTYGEVARAIAA